MIHTIESLKLTQYISEQIDDNTFHHHYHILYDIVNTFDGLVNYLEIGCYAGGSASLVIQRPNTNVYSIDLGNPIKPEIAINNILKLNKNNNYFKYFQGDSTSGEILKMVEENIDNVDVLFIDGDHSYNGVIKDFNNYEKYVKNGGYIIFDDYNDRIHSPYVKTAVDNIVSKLSNYDIIGTLPNIYGARPETLKDGNCFIVRKK